MQAAGRQAGRQEIGGDEVGELLPLLAVATLFYGEEGIWRNESNLGIGQGSPRAKFMNDALAPFLARPW
eukprot:scaffold12017_cov120-Isochrysis_galbana.AAC.8